MTVRDELAAVLAESLAVRGFRRRAGSWYRVGPALYAVVNLQASRWDESFYVNIGFAPVGNVPSGWLPESKCLVRFRLEAIKEVSSEDLRLMDENAFSALGQAEWRQAAAKRLVAPVVGVLERAVDISGLRQVLEAEVSGRVMIHAAMRPLLGLA